MSSAVTTSLPPGSPSFLVRLQQWGRVHPFWYYTAPLAAWVAFITWGCLAPPDELPQVHLPFFDKVEHASIYIILGALLLRAWVRATPVRPAAALAMWAIAAAWGLYIEFMQRLTGYRTFDLRDAASNAAGAAIGLALWTLLARRFAREPVQAAEPVAPASEALSLTDAPPSGKESA